MREIEKWSAKSYEELRSQLASEPFERADTGTEYHVEVNLLENREDYVQVMVSVCSERVRWSCIHPLSGGFLVYRDGRVDK